MGSAEDIVDQPKSKLRIHWHLPRFLNSMLNGESIIKEPTSGPGQQTWRFQVHPNIHHGNVSHATFTVSVSNPPGVPEQLVIVHMKFGFEDDNGDRIWISESFQGFDVDQATVDGSFVSKSIKIATLCPQCDPLQLSLRPDGCLHVVCEIKLVQPRTFLCVCERKHGHTKRPVDVMTASVGSEDEPKGSMIDGDFFLELLDQIFKLMAPQAAAAACDFGNDLRRDLCSDETFNFRDATMKLLRLAKQQHLPGFEGLCRAQLSEPVNSENFCRLIEVADVCDDLQTKSKLIEFFVANMDSVTNNRAEWKRFAERIKSLVLELQEEVNSRFSTGGKVSQPTSNSSCAKSGK